LDGIEIKGSNKLSKKNLNSVSKASFASFQIAPLKYQEPSLIGKKNVFGFGIPYYTDSETPPPKLKNKDLHAFPGIVLEKRQEKNDSVLLVDYSCDPLVPEIAETESITEDQGSLQSRDIDMTGMMEVLSLIKSSK
jgi:hypothetical protein